MYYHILFFAGRKNDTSIAVVSMATGANYVRDGGKSLSKPRGPPDYHINTT